VSRFFDVVLLRCDVRPGKSSPGTVAPVMGLV